MLSSEISNLNKNILITFVIIKTLFKKKTYLKWVGVRMTQKQNDTVRHFGMEGHFDTATNWHGVLLISSFFN